MTIDAIVTQTPDGAREITARDGVTFSMPPRIIQAQIETPALDEGAWHTGGR